MSNFAAFTAHFKIIPSFGPAYAPGSKFTAIRDMQRIAYWVYQALLSADNVNIATPGGGQAMNLNQVDLYSDLASGCAVKPQIGQNPAQLMITGFYNVGGQIAQPVSNMPAIGAGSNEYYDQTNGDFGDANGGHYITGPGGNWGWGGSSGQPTSAVNSEVVALVASINAAIAASPSNAKNSVSLFRLEYNGIIFGDRGYTFPSS